MAVIESLDLVMQLRFDAAIQDHIAKKATNRRIKFTARQKAQQFRELAAQLECDGLAADLAP